MLIFVSSTSAAIDILVNAYIIPVIALVVLLVVLKFNHLFSKKQTRLFLCAVIVNLTMILVTAVDLLLAQNKGEPYGVFRCITTFINFAAGPLVPLFLFQIFNKVKGKYWLYIPFVINFVLCFISMFNHMIFKVTLTNSYDRGPLFFVPFIISIFYTLLIIVYPFQDYREGRSKERLFILFILFVLVACILLEVFFNIRCLLYGASAAGLVLYYLLQNILFFMTDPLTGVYNRQVYNHELEKAEDSERCLVALADLNKLKFINDTFGHKAGDRALVQVARSLRFHSSSIAHLYRIGGDEFILISLKATKENFINCLVRAGQDAEKSGYSFAWAIAEYKRGDDMQDVLKLVDKEMYEMKKTMAKKREQS